MAVTQEQAPEDELLALRSGYLDNWEELTGAGVTGLERFALTVQRVVDQRYERDHAAVESDSELLRLILDDLVDLFVTEDHAREKRLLMSSESVLGWRALGDMDDPLDGFAPHLQPGEGRYRHFALSAAGALVAPNLLVDLAARVRGNDLVPDSADSRADVATNEIGRRFTGFLRSTPIAELAGEGAVANWIREAFGTTAR